MINTFETDILNRKDNCLINTFELSLLVRQITVMLDTHLNCKKRSIEISKEILERYKDSSDYLQGLCKGEVNAKQDQLLHDESIISEVNKNVNQILEMIREAKEC